MALDRKTVMLLALVVSVGVNMFLIGALSGRFMDRDHRTPRPVALSWMLRDMEPAMRSRMEPRMEEFAETLRPLRSQMFHAQRQLNQLMSTEPLDEGAVIETFRELREANMAYQEASHAQILEMLKQMSPEQRAHAMRFMSGRRSPARELVRFHRHDGGEDDRHDQRRPVPADSQPADPTMEQDEEETLE